MIGAYGPLIQPLTNLEYTLDLHSKSLDSVRREAPV